MGGPSATATTTTTNGSGAAECTEVKILTPVGMLGYGFSHSLLRSSIIDHRPDAIILDSGSTDSGPAKLATGETTCPRSSYEYDMGPMLEQCFHQKVPLLISSSGGDGTDEHVDMLMEIIREHSEAYGTSFKVIQIYANVDKEIVHAKLSEGKISPCGPVHELTPELVDTTRTIVTQMGHEPMLKAMEEHPDFDVMITGRAYDPAPYAAYTLFKSNRRIPLGIAYHMGKIMECGALCAEPKSRTALATVREDSFDIRPLDPGARCTRMSVAAHTLYEKARPDILIGPGGHLDLTQSTYEELDDGVSVRSRGVQFVPAPIYTLKLEGARPVGFRYMFMGGIRDPILIGQIEPFVASVKEYAAFMNPHVDYKLAIHIYGKNAIMGAMEPETVAGHEIFLVGEIQAPTAEQARAVCHTARVACMHRPYEGQLATAGNFAMMGGPALMPMGVVADFTMYHLMQVDDPMDFVRIVVDDVKATKPPTPPEDAKSAQGAERPAPFIKPKVPLKKNVENPVYISDIARVFRSKNAGPFELTMDIMFPVSESERYFALKNASPPVLSAEVVGKLYRLDPEKVTVIWWDQALSFKTTIPRPQPSGGFGETDVQGAQMHVPLLKLRLDGKSDV